MSLMINLSLYPTAIQKAVLAILRFEDEVVDPIGYDNDYYVEDLPEVVRKALTRKQ